MIVVLDTNVVLRMFGAKSTLQKLVEAISYGRISVAVSPAIWLEYEEISLALGGEKHWEKLDKLFTLVSAAHGTIVRTQPAFRFATIPADPDDNAFADCAISAHADFVLTDDRHFRSLTNAGYKPQPLNPEDFIVQYL